jgi:hypothetical protein
MPFYVSAEALLSDVRLRLDATSENFGSLIVEGPDDKRLFYRHVVWSQLITVSGGRTLLVSALEKARDTDKQRMLFLTDCDYEVMFGTLSGGPDRVITANADVESDLIELGMLGRIVEEVVPRALNSPSESEEITREVFQRSVAFARPLGRMRAVVQPFGIGLDLGNLDFGRHRIPNSTDVDLDKLYRTVYARIRDSGLTATEFRSRAESMPSLYQMCKGKDLVRAIHFVLRRDYRVPNNVTPDVLASMLRFGLEDRRFESWEVTRRIRGWEARTGSVILREKETRAD